MLERVKRDVCDAAIAIFKNNSLSSVLGSVSALDRDSGCIVIKPAEINGDSMRPADMIAVDMRGYKIDGILHPPKDLMTHIEIYRSFPEIGSIIHIHSFWATAWAQSGRDIPVYGTTHSNTFYGPVPCTRKLNIYETSERYEENVGKLIVETYKGFTPSERPAVLVRSHGPYIFGVDTRAALHNFNALETIAQLAFYTELLGNNTPIQDNLIDRHFFANHDM